VGHAPESAGGGKAVGVPGNVVPDRSDIRRAACIQIRLRRGSERLDHGSVTQAQRYM